MKRKKPTRKASEFPKFQARFEPWLRARLEVASLLLGQSINTLVSEAADAYLKALPAKQRKEVEQLAERIVSRFE